MTLLYLFHLVGLILLLMWNACGRLSHKPKCFPLLLFPTLALAMQENCTTSFAHTSHTGQGQSTASSKDISPMASGDTHMPLQESHQTSLVPLVEDVWLFHMAYLLVRARTEIWNYLNTSFYLEAAEQHKTLAQLIRQGLIWLSVFPYSWVISEHMDNTSLTTDP